MGRDITLYPKKASKKELKDFLESLGFTKCTHLWDWPKGTLNYYWFETEDYKSIDGVSADIYPVDKDENIYNDNTWALHVRNLYSASLYDVKMMNHVLRSARKRFGGTITSDYGINKYAELWEDDSTPLSRGLSRIYVHILQTMYKMEISIPDNYLKLKDDNIETDKTMLKFMKEQDPARIIYNGLVPFLVSMFEYFFSETFQVLIKYDEFALKKKEEFNLKVNFQTLLELDRKERTIENIISMNYTFQNLDQLNKAYKEWLNIDVRKILYKKKKIGSSIKYLENRISDIIQYRHGIVHHFILDYSLDKKDFLNLLQTIKHCIEEFVIFLEQKYKFKVERS